MGGTSFRQAQGRLPRPLAGPDLSGSGLPGRDFEIVIERGVTRGHPYAASEIASKFWAACAIRGGHIDLVRR